jgi:hypothetical protein
MVSNNNSNYNEYRGLLDDDELVLAEAENALQENDGERGPNKDPGTKRQIGGAAVAGGLAGFLLVGPVVGLAAAGGAAMCASQARGKAGNVARASGEVMATAGDRLKRLDQKHHVVDKTSRGIVKGCNWVSHKLQPKTRRPETQRE